MSEEDGSGVNAMFCESFFYLLPLKGELSVTKCTRLTKEGRRWRKTEEEEKFKSILGMNNKLNFCISRSLRGFTSFLPDSFQVSFLWKRNCWWQREKKWKTKLSGDGWGWECSGFVFSLLQSVTLEENSFSLGTVQWRIFAIFHIFTSNQAQNWINQENSNHSSTEKVCILLHISSANCSSNQQSLQVFSRKFPYGRKYSFSSAHEAFFAVLSWRLFRALWLRSWFPLVKQFKCWIISSHYS